MYLPNYLCLTQPSQELVSVTLEFFRYLKIINKNDIVLESSFYYFFNSVKNMSWYSVLDQTVIL